jgi:DNA (cytosine-5)-methyltransferase 1
LRNRSSRRNDEDAFGHRSFRRCRRFSQGFLRANQEETECHFDLKLLVDSDPSASFTFKKNFPRIPFWTADIAKIGADQLLTLARVKPGTLDFLIGGPPCQGFSPNGKRWLEDNRNRLFARFIELAHALRPKCVILENVPTALSAFAQIFAGEVEEAFRGYVVRTAVLNACEFGVPQIRRRAFVVALREDLGISDFEFPFGEFDSMDVGRDSHTDAKAAHRFVSVEEAIGDLPELRAGDAVDGQRYLCDASTDYQRARREGAIALFNHIARSHSREFLEKIAGIQPGEGNAQLPDGERFSDNYFSQAYARLHPRGIGFTITAHFRNPGSGRFTHYRGQSLNHCARSGTTPILRRSIHLSRLRSRSGAPRWQRCAASPCRRACSSFRDDGRKPMKRHTDHVDALTRSAIMRAVKNRRVKSTELSLRAKLAAAGIRGWCMYARDLPGTPDFVFQATRIAIFVDGCFWHGCPRCYRRPHSHREYWDAKVIANRIRDRRTNRALRRLGWRVLRIWEHELKPKGGALLSINALLGSARACRDRRATHASCYASGLPSRRNMVLLCPT